MSSSSETAPVTAGGPRITTLSRPDLREGAWTRLGPAGLLGDAQTEETLARVAEQTRSSARAQGYAVGWAQGRREAAEQATLVAEAEEQRLAEAEARREAEHRSAIEALSAAATQLQALTDATVGRVEEQATALAWELVRELMAREVAVATGPDVVRRALALAPDSPLAAVRVNPSVAADAAVRELADGDGRGVRIVPDAALGRADALVEIDDHVLDLRIGTALERVREVLR